MFVCLLMVMEGGGLCDTPFKFNSLHKSNIILVCLFVTMKDMILLTAKPTWFSFTVKVQGRVITTLMDEKSHLGKLPLFYLYFLKLKYQVYGQHPNLLYP